MSSNIIFTEQVGQTKVTIERVNDQILSLVRFFTHFPPDEDRIE